MGKIPDIPLFLCGAYDIAAEAHRHQTRSGGSPYIEHPIRVSKIAGDLFDKGSFHADVDMRTLVQAAAYLHDVAEDTSMTERDIVMRLSYLIPTVGEFDPQALLFAALWALNKRHHADYLAYLLAVRANPIALIVKTADLIDNTSDLKPGNMRDKYLLARHILS